MNHISSEKINTEIVLPRLAVAILLTNLFACGAEDDSANRALEALRASSQIIEETFDENNSNNEENEDSDNDETEDNNENQDSEIAAVLNHTPLAGANSVHVNSAIKILFSNSVDTTDYDLTVSVSDGNGSVNGETVISGAQLVFTPSTPLEYETFYSVSVSSTVESNIEIANAYWSFSTQTEGALVLFENVTSTAIDTAPQVKGHFWVGMPDVNGDGCFDIFVGTHSDDIASAMYLHDNAGGACQGTFTYFANNNNYTQAGPVTPRITSRYMFGNWYDHPEGIWSFFGHDVDGNPGARYAFDPTVGYGEAPRYVSKINGCYDTRSICIPLDVTGDGDIELAINSFDSSPLARQIVNAIDGTIEYPSDSERHDDYGTSYLVFDINNNGYPEIISTHAGGYFSYSRYSDSWTWIANVFTNPIYSDTDYSPTNNHEITLDYDSDGDLDIWSGRGTYSEDGKMAFVLARNNGDGTFTDVSEAAGIWSLDLHSESYWTTYANTVAADINLDGYPDILVSGETYGNNVTVLLNNGNGTFTVDRSINFGTSWVNSSGKAWMNTVDYDNDGMIDIVKTHDQSSDNHASVGLFRNTLSTPNHWLRIRARGFGQNTDGLHTRITLLEPGTSNIISHYQVGAFTTGYQNLVTHAGVGTFEQVDLDIQYPHGGPKYTYENIAVDQDVIVFYNGEIIQGYTPGQAIPLTAQ